MPSGRTSFFTRPDAQVPSISLITPHIHASQLDSATQLIRTVVVVLLVTLFSWTARPQSPFIPYELHFTLLSCYVGVAYNVYLARIHTHVHACIRPCFAPFGMHSSSLICTAFYSFYISSNLIGLIYRSVLLYFDVYLRLCAETFLNLKVSNIIR